MKKLNAKHIISLIIISVMIITSLPFTAVEAYYDTSYYANTDGDYLLARDGCTEAFTSSDGLWRYQILEDGTVSIGNTDFTGGDFTCYLGYSTDITIPAQIDGRRVSYIGIFSTYNTVNSITVSPGISHICDEAFYGKTSLTSIVLPDTITYIGQDAFTNTGLYNDPANWYDGVFYIGKNLIKANAGITGTYRIKDGTTLIASKAFDYDWDSYIRQFVYLTGIIAPESLKHINRNAFDACPVLTDINLPNSIESIGYDAFFGTAYYKDTGNWESGVLYIGNCLIKAKNDIAGLYSIKSNTHTVADSAFSGCTQLTSVSIPDSVENIGRAAFYGCSSLNNVVLPAGLDAINQYTFSQCSALKSITVPSGISYIGYKAFYYCTSLTSFTVPASVSLIDGGVFTDCISLASITVNSANPYYLSDNGVLYSKDKSVLVCYPCGRSGKSYSVNGNVKILEKQAFMSCASLESITLPNGLTKIYDEAFNGCIALKNLTIPDSVTIIGTAAFRNCEALATVKLPGNIKELRHFTFSYCKSLKTIVLPDSLEYLGEECFVKCLSLNNVTIPDGIKKIGYGTFYNCTSLTNIVLSDAVTEIDGYAFSVCTSLKSIVFPKSVESIEYSAFYYCISLSSVTFSYENIEIAGTAFERCYSLANVYGYRGSRGEEFAKENGYKFIPIGGYPDVINNAWYYYPVMYNAEYGLMTGYSSGKFGPGDALKRQDFVVIIARLAGADLAPFKNLTGGFSDVQKGSYYAPAVAWAVKNGIISGYKNGKFGVGDKITREQVATILYRYYKCPKNDYYESALSWFKDGNQVSEFAKDAMEWAIRSSIISGKNSYTLAPTATASRAEIATIIWRIHDPSA